MSLPPRARGYILMEVAIGGAMLAIVIGTLLSAVADARAQNVAAGRDVIAAQLALEKVEQNRALGCCSNITAATCGSDTPLAGFTRTCTFAAAAPTTVNGVAMSCQTFSVTVTYQTDAGGRANRTETIPSEVCQ